MSEVKGTIAFDFDGVLSEGAGYHWPLTGLDLTLIHQAQQRGYAVVVMTCNDVGQVAECLLDHGVAAMPDWRMSRMSWHDREVVLVTGRKVCADAYIDDRAIRYQFGQDTEQVWTQIADSTAEIPGLAS